MPAPDLPMRERIAEALYYRDMDAQPDAEPVPGWRRISEARKDIYRADTWKLLTVLADLPDTAVEAGLVEEERHEWFTYGTGSTDCQCGTNTPGGETEWEKHRFRAAVIAAIKEGKA